MNHPLDQLISEERIDQVVRECAQLVRDEVARKRGMSGVVIKTGFKLVEKVRPSIINDLFYSLLPAFVERLRPFYDAYLEQGETHLTGLSDYLISRSTEVASSLLEVTDDRAQRSTMSALVGAYRKLRPLAMDQIAAAVPMLGALIERQVSRKG